MLLLPQPLTSALLLLCIPARWESSRHATSATLWRRARARPWRRSGAGQLGLAHLGAVPAAQPCLHAADVCSTPAHEPEPQHPHRACQLESSACTRLLLWRRRDEPVRDSRGGLRPDSAGAATRRMFTKLPGVGPKVAQQWWERGLRWVQGMEQTGGRQRMQQGSAHACLLHGRVPGPPLGQCLDVSHVAAKHAPASQPQLRCCRTYEDVLEAAAGRGPGLPGAKPLTLNPMQARPAAAAVVAAVWPQCSSSSSRRQPSRTPLECQGSKGWGNNPAAPLPPLPCLQRFALEHRQDLLEGTGGCCRLAC